MRKSISLLLCLTLTSVFSQSAKRNIKEIGNSMEEIQTVWPGFPKSIDHGIYTKNGSIYLLSDRQQLVGWKLKDTIGSNFIWYKKDKSLKKFKRSFMVQQEIEPDLIIDAVMERQAPIKTLFHESFHGFQDSMVQPGEIDWSTVVVDTHMIQIKRAEFNLLFNILQAKDKKAKEEQIALYSSLRNFRENMMTSQNIELERNMEWQEGVATYVGHRVNEIVNKQKFTKQLLAYGQKLSNSAGYKETENFMRSDAYFHGASICYILNQYDDNWQQQISQGKTPFELLTGIFPPFELDESEVESSLKLKENNEAIVAEAFDAITAWEKALVIDVGLTGRLSFVAQNMESKPGGTLITGASKVHTDNEYIELSGKAKKLYISDELAAFKLSKTPDKFNQCQQVDVDNYRCKAGTLLKFKGIKIKVKKAIRLLKNKQQWFVKISS
jgi:hypothetical protein